MPRVERAIDTTQQICRVESKPKEWKTLERIESPKDATNARLIVEWDNPPVDDWTPKDVAVHIAKRGIAEIDLLSQSHFINLIDAANKIAELERAKCAEVVNQMMEDYGKEFECQYETLLDAKVRILARTNDEAGYPRMEK